jgi:hypothetical protein
MSQPTNIVRLRRSPNAAAQRHPKHLMEAVYASGSLAVAPDDLATKMSAALLATLGFFVIEEIQPDGVARRLQRGEARRALAAQRPWRVSRPAFDGDEIGLPEAIGRAGSPR